MNIIRLRKKWQLFIITTKEGSRNFYSVQKY